MTQISKYNENGIQFIKVPIKLFKLIWCDKPKRSVYGNFINANFFGSYSQPYEGEPTIYFTLPVAHLLCDIDKSTENKAELFYQESRGKFVNNDTQWLFNSNTWQYMNDLYQKTISTLLISKDNRAIISDIKDFNESYASTCKYAVSGVPCLKDGNDVKWYDYVSKQGWGAGTVRNTWHNFVGIKYGDEDNLYLMQWQSNNKISNLIYSAEFYNKIKNLGFKDIIKLDGGGSFICRSETIGIDQYTDENRRINCIITFDPSYDDADKEIDRLTAENAKLSKENTELKADVENYKAKYNSAKKERDEMETDLKTYIMNMNEVRNNVLQIADNMQKSVDKLKNSFIDT